MRTHTHSHTHITLTHTYIIFLTHMLICILMQSHSPTLTFTQHHAYTHTHTHTHTQSVILRYNDPLATLLLKSRRLIFQKHVGEPQQFEFILNFRFRGLTVFTSQVGASDYRVLVIGVGFIILSVVMKSVS